MTRPRWSAAPAWLPQSLGSAWSETTAALEKFERRLRPLERINPKRALGLDYEDVRLRTSDGLQLGAWWVPAPSAATAGRAVILHHHFGAQKAYVLPWVERFHRAGLACLAIDGRGHRLSEGDYGLGAFVERARDVRAAVGYLRSRGIRQVVGFGGSQGAALVALGLHDAPELAGLILESGPAAEMWSAVWGVSGQLLAPDGAPGIVSHLVLAARVVRGAEPLRYALSLWRALYRCRRAPLLWIHGDADRVVGRRNAQLWFATLAPLAHRWRAVHVARGRHVRSLEDGGPVVGREVTSFLERLW
jgi:pimeloyl-ACP methyl ester carboxylesterase